MLRLLTRSATARVDLVPTERGRVRAVLASLSDRWDGLTPAQRARALELLAELAAVVRAREIEAVKEVPAQAG